MLLLCVCLIRDSCSSFAVHFFLLFVYLPQSNSKKKNLNNSSLLFLCTCEIFRKSSSSIESLFHCGHKYIHINKINTFIIFALYVWAEQRPTINKKQTSKQKKQVNKKPHRSHWRIWTQRNSIELWWSIVDQRHTHTKYTPRDTLTHAHTNTPTTKGR